jgi:hypothetical protein
MSDDNLPPPYVYDGLDPAAEPKSSVAEVSDAVKDTVNRIGDAINAGRKPSMPISILSNADTRALCNRCASADYFLQPRLKFLHDAHVLAKFGRLQSVDQVRLAGHHENWPDGLVEVQNRAFNIEVTSTHGGRKLGDEYRHLKGWRFDPVEDCIDRANSIPQYLDKVISSKSKRNYSSPCWLVVYLNISEYGIRQIETEQVIAATKARYAAAFVDITVLWKGKLY